jgi:hypothetical protein
MGGDDALACALADAVETAASTPRDSLQPAVESAIETSPAHVEARHLAAQRDTREGHGARRRRAMGTGRICPRIDPRCTQNEARASAGTTRDDAFAP